MDELEFIKELEKFSEIGDDSYLLNEKQVISKDMIAEGTHYLSSTPLEHILHKLFVSNMSDILAMGAVPTMALLGVAVSNRDSLNKISKIVKEECRKYNISLIGGDTIRIKEGSLFSLTIIGELIDKPILRSGARVGDLIYLSRPVGLNYASLICEINELNDIDKYLHYKKEPEIELINYLPSRIITSMTDISDGLALDLYSILEASNVNVIIDYNNFNHLIKYKELFAREGKSIKDAFFSSGEEYALLFTAPKEKAKELEEEIKRNMKREIIKLGEIVEKAEECRAFYIDENNELEVIERLGYIH